VAIQVVTPLSGEPRRWLNSRCPGPAQQLPDRLGVAVDLIARPRPVRSPEWLGDSAEWANFRPETIQDGGCGRTDRLMPMIFSEFFNGAQQRREPHFPGGSC
jgi:hypothetical protein